MKDLNTITLAEYKKAQKTRKYFNRKCKCNLGHNHDSKFELDYCYRLQTLKNKGEIKDFWYEHSFTLHACNNKEIGVHKPDFTVITNSSTEVWECKAKKTVTPLWKWKKKMFEIEYPDIPYIVKWKKDWSKK